MSLTLSALVMPAVVGAQLSGCTQPAVPTSVISQAEVAAQTATTVVADAQAAWPIVKALLPPADQAPAQDAFDKTVFTANHAILVLNDAIGAAIAANNPTPDLSKLLSALSDAVAQVLEVVKEFTSKAPAATAKMRVAPSGVDVISDMEGGVAKLRAAVSK
jgi:hypothetical protein